MKVLFVGINNKKGILPLATETVTGNIIDRIAYYFDVSLKTNLCPFEIKGKHPNESEIKEGFELLKKLIAKENPDRIVSLGKLVAENIEEFKAIKIKHPSYANRQGKKYVDNYVINSVEKITKGDIE